MTAAATRPGRMIWMDVVRGVCIVLVVVFHANSAIVEHTAVAVDQTLNIFNTFFGPYRMPVLMFLSGMLLHQSLKKPGGVYFYGKFAKIYWPFLIFSLFILLAIGRLTWESALKMPLTTPTVLWYLWFLCAYYVLAYGINKARIPFWLVALLALAASPFLPEAMRVSRFAYLFFFFLAGHVYMENRERLRVPVTFGVLCLLVAIAGGLMSVFAEALQLPRMRYNSFFVWIPLSMIVMILAFAPYYKGGPRFRTIEWVGRNSMVFYVMHFPAQVITVRVLEAMGVDNYAIMFFSAIATALAAGALMQFARSRYEPLEGLFDFDRLRRRPVPA